MIDESQRSFWCLHLGTEKISKAALTIMSYTLKLLVWGHTKIDLKTMYHESLKNGFRVSEINIDKIGVWS